MQDGSESQHAASATAIGGVWATKTRAEVLADIKAFYESLLEDKPALKLYVYDPKTDGVREATAEDLRWVLDANDQWIPHPVSPLKWPMIPAVSGYTAAWAVKRVQPRVVRNAGKHHVVKAFRRPW